jgi:hypothetical protein
VRAIVKDSQLPLSPSRLTRSAICGATWRTFTSWVSLYATLNRSTTSVGSWSTSAVLGPCRTRRWSISARRALRRSYGVSRRVCRGWWLIGGWGIGGIGTR